MPLSELDKSTPGSTPLLGQSLAGSPGLASCRDTAAQGQLMKGGTSDVPWEVRNLPWPGGPPGEGSCPQEGLGAG